MKRFLVLILAAFGFMQISASAAEKADERVLVIVNDDNTLTLDEKFSDRATLLLKEQGNEYHLFTCDTIVAIKKTNNSKLRVEIGEKNTYQFYRTNGQFAAVAKWLEKNMILVGPKQGFAATKFKVGVSKTMLFIHRPISYEFINDNVGGLDINYADKYQKLTGADTLKVSEKDTCSIAVTIGKPANMLYAGLYVNNKSVREYSVVNDKFFDKETVKEVIRPELLTKDFNTVQVKYLALDENGALKAELKDEFFIIKEKANAFAWLSKLVTWVGLAVLLFLAAFVGLVIFYLRRRNKKSNKKVKWDSDFVATIKDMTNSEEIIQKAKEFDVKARGVLYRAEVNWLLADDKNKAKLAERLKYLRTEYSALWGQFTEFDINLNHISLEKIFEEQLKMTSDPNSMRKIAAYRLRVAEEELISLEDGKEKDQKKVAFENLKAEIKNRKIVLSDENLNPETNNDKRSALENNGADQSTKNNVTEQGGNDEEQQPEVDKTDYKKAYEDCLKELGEARKKNDDFKDTVTTLTKDKEGVEEHAKELNEKLTEANNKIFTLNQQVSGLEDENRSLNDKLKKSEKALQAQAEAHSRVIDGLIEQHKKEMAKKDNEHQQKITEINSEHEAEIKDKDNDIMNLHATMADDREYLFNFYSNTVENLEKYVNACVAHSDSASAIYTEINEIVNEENNSNNFNVFKNFCRQEFESDKSVKEVMSVVREKLIDHLGFETSWCNALARVYAYSRVNGLESIFGYYGAYKKEIELAYMTMCKLAAMFEVREIVLPELFKDTYVSDRYEFKNSNLVLPEMGEEYLNILASVQVPNLIYDVLNLGYTSQGKSVKPVVAYYPNVYTSF